MKYSNSNKTNKMMKRKRNAEIYPNSMTGSHVLSYI